MTILLVVTSHDQAINPGGDVRRHRPSREVNLVLNPTLQVEEYPLKRYYREVPKGLIQNAVCIFPCRATSDVIRPESNVQLQL